MSSFNKNDVIVTKHAAKRIKQRICKSIQSTADKAWENGIPYRIVKGQIRRYLNKIAFRTKYLDNNITKMSLFNGYVFLFSENVLVTVIQIPGRLLESAHKIFNKIENIE